MSDYVGLSLSGRYKVEKKFLFLKEIESPATQPNSMN
jgi:hypothetical protein